MEWRLGGCCDVKTERLAAAEQQHSEAGHRSSSTRGAQHSTAQHSAAQHAPASAASGMRSCRKRMTHSWSYSAASSRALGPRISSACLAPAAGEGTAKTVREQSSCDGLIPGSLSSCLRLWCGAATACMHGPNSTIDLR